MQATKEASKCIQVRHNKEIKIRLNDLFPLAHLKTTMCKEHSLITLCEVTERKLAHRDQNLEMQVENSLKKGEK